MCAVGRNQNSGVAPHGAPSLVSHLLGGENKMLKIHRVILAASALAYAIVGSGCIAMGSAQKADTMGKGNMQFGIEPGAIGGTVAGQFAVVPDFNASRFG